MAKQFIQNKIKSPEISSKEEELNTLDKNIVNSINNKLVLNNNLVLIICGDFENYKIQDYNYSDGFNQTLKSKKIKIEFKNKISIKLADEKNTILN